jgi:hypothetical protein
MIKATLQLKHKKLAFLFALLVFFGGPAGASFAQDQERAEGAENASPHTKNNFSFLKLSHLNSGVSYLESPY